MATRRDAHFKQQSGVFILAVACMIAGLCTRWGPAVVIPSEPAQALFKDPEMSTESFAEKSPFVVVVVSYCMQSSIAILCLLTFSMQVHYRRRSSSQLNNIKQSLWICLGISTMGVFVYLYFALGPCTFLTVKSLDGGPHLGLRNLFWMFSTPTQWYVFVRAHTTATTTEASTVLTATLAMQVFGMALVATTAPLWGSVWFIAGCLAFAVMFDAAFRLPLLKEFRHISRLALHVELTAWSLYSIALCLRTAGVISPWHEQVLIYSILDMATKTMTLNGIIMVQLHVVLTGAHEALQAVENRSNGRASPPSVR